MKRFKTGDRVVVAGVGKEGIVPRGRVVASVTTPKGERSDSRVGAASRGDWSAKAPTAVFEAPEMSPTIQPAPSRSLAGYPAGRGSGGTLWGHA